MYSTKQDRLYCIERVLFVLILLFSHSSCFAQQNPEEIKKIFFDRIEKLSNVIISYRETIRHIPVSLLDMPAVQKHGDGSITVISTGTEIHDREYWRLGDIILYKKTPISIEPEVELDFTMEKMNQIIVALEDRTEMFTEHQRDNSLNRYSRNIWDATHIWEPEFEAALGLRFTVQHRRIDLKLIQNSKVVFSDEQDANISIIFTDHYIREYELSPELGYAPISLELRRPEEDRIVSRTQMSDFKNVDGLMLPFEIEYQKFLNIDGQQHKGRSKHFTINEYRFNDPNNIIENYRIDWPEGTTVSDYRSGQGTVYRGTAPPRSLLKRTLPELMVFGIDMSPSDVKDKQICVCFFDIEQRPSRNLLLQLNKRAKELVEKDIVVFAVHASKADKDFLNNWMNENQMPFTLGIIDDNEQKTKVNWGVASLPWLIMTNRNHIVVAEGFSMNELDEIIADTGK